MSYKGQFPSLALKQRSPTVAAWWHDWEGRGERGHAIGGLVCAHMHTVLVQAASQRAHAQLKLCKRQAGMHMQLPTGPPLTEVQLRRHVCPANRPRPGSGP